MLPGPHAWPTMATGTQVPPAPTGRQAGRQRVPVAHLQCPPQGLAYRGQGAHQPGKHGMCVILAREERGRHQDFLASSTPDKSLLILEVLFGPNPSHMHTHWVLFLQGAELPWRRLSPGQTSGSDRKRPRSRRTLQATPAAPQRP